MSYITKHVKHTALFTVYTNSKVAKKFSQYNRIYSQLDTHY